MSSPGSTRTYRSTNGGSSRENSGKEGGTKNFGDGKAKNSGNNVFFFYFSSNTPGNKVS